MCTLPVTLKWIKWKKLRGEEIFMYIYSACLIPPELILTLGLEGMRWHINTQENSF